MWHSQSQKVLFCNTTFQPFFGYIKAYGTRNNPVAIPIDYSDPKEVPTFMHQHNIWPQSSTAIWNKSSEERTSPNKVNKNPTLFHNQGCYLILHIYRRLIDTCNWKLLTDKHTLLISSCEISTASIPYNLLKFICHFWQIIRSMHLS